MSSIVYEQSMEQADRKVVGFDTITRDWNAYYMNDDGRCEYIGSAPTEAAARVMLDGYVYGLLSHDL